MYNNLRYDLVSFKRTDHKKWLKSPFRFTHQFFYQRWTTMRNNCRLRRWGIVQFRWWWKWWFLWTMSRRNWPRLCRFRIHHRSGNCWMQTCLCRRTKWVYQKFWAPVSAHLRYGLFWFSSLFWNSATWQLSLAQNRLEPFFVVKMTPKDPPEFWWRFCELLKYMGRKWAGNS